MTPRAYVVAGALVALGGWWVWPSDRAKIRHALEQLATAASASADEPPLAAVGRAAALTGLLAPDIEVVLGEGLELRGRENVVAAAIKLVSLAAPVQVAVGGADITATGGSAQARVTLTVTTPSRGAQRFDGEGLLVALTRVDSDWRVTRIEVERALAKPR